MIYLRAQWLVRIPSCNHWGRKAPTSSKCLVQHGTKRKFVSLCCKYLYANSEHSSSVFYACLMLNNSTSSVEAIKHAMYSRFQWHACCTLVLTWRNTTDSTTSLTHDYLKHHETVKIPRQSRFLQFLGFQWQQKWTRQDIRQIWLWESSVIHKLNITAHLHISIWPLCGKQYTGCFTTLGHNCRRWFPRFLWSKKFI